MTGATTSELHLVHEMMKKKKLPNYETVLSEGNFKGTGFLGDITFIKITALTENKQKKCYNIIVKSSKRNDELREKLQCRAVFEREVFMYTEVFPKFYQFQIDKGIKELYNIFAKCYHFSLENKKEAIVLQNTKILGFDIHDKARPHDLDHALMVFRNYAKFHALSLAMRHQNPMLFKNLTKNLNDVLGKIISVTGFLQTCQRGFHKTVDLLMNSNDAESEIVRKLNQYDDEEINRIGTNLLEDPDSPQSVIKHSDCWNNNIMFKYKDVEKTMPTDVIFVDFQGSTVGSPAADLSSYFYACCDKTVFKHFDFLLRAYHKTLCDCLKELGCDRAEEIFSLEDLNFHWVKYGMFGLVMSLVIVKLELAESDEVMDFDDTLDGSCNNPFDITIRNEKLFEERLKDNFLHFAKLL